MLRNGLEPWHLLIVVVLFLLLFGSKKLPDTARALGKSMRILKSEAKAMKGEEGVPGAQAAPGAQPASAAPGMSGGSAAPGTSGTAGVSAASVDAASAGTVSGESAAR
ncbi:Sec-independent protein translocase subunit TatA [Streptomyces sp. NBC_00005]|uniref:Sec-independent protein translocase subunit TatA n=1 Tax=Streptomyces sp. NBC_00005 TaxID=2903609 RepID=UPI003255E540